MSEDKAKTITIERLSDGIYWISQKDIQNLTFLEKEIRKGGVVKVSLVRVEDYNKDVNQLAGLCDKWEKEAKAVLLALQESTKNIEELERRLNRIRLFIEKEKFWESDTWVLPYYGLLECLGKEKEI